MISNPLKNKDGWYIDNLRLDNNINKVDEFISSNAIVDLSIYPNPATNNANLELISSKPTKLRIELVDILGNIVSEVISSKFITAGKFEFKLDLSNLNNGVYFVKVISSSELKSIPITIVK